MCGIFGYVGQGRSFSFLIEALTRLEYRGYDSCGIAAISQGKLFLKKRAGKIHQLKADLKSLADMKTTNSVLHSRWATHGEPNKLNAHPHLDKSKNIALVHNGIIENFAQLKEELVAEGYKFLSETDSEVIVQLIAKFYKSSLEEAVVKAIKRLKGSFAFGVSSLREPDKLIGARFGSPLIVGLSRNENFLASDIPALLPFTKKVIYLNDREIAVLTKKKVMVFNFQKQRLKPKVEQSQLKTQEAQKKGYQHFMLKEIFEQPAILRKIYSLYCKADQVRFSDLKLTDSYLRKIKKIYITACGTAYHAGYLAKYFLEKYCQIDIEVDTSSEFRYRKLNLRENGLLIAISQSGETADTLAAVKEAKKSKTKILAVCNVLGSSLVKEADGLISTLAGPEIGVASTKTYTAQVFCLYLFSVYLAGLRGNLSRKEAKLILKSLKNIASGQERILEDSQTIKKIANKFSKFGSFLFLGRGINYPIALEGALKLKEISYIPAEGYPAGEMKHGPIALIDEYRAVVCIAPKDELHEKMISNMQEVKARKGTILAILNCQDTEAISLSNEKIFIPPVDNPEVNPLLVVVCLQLFAYFVAKNLGCEIDQPRNLAKSVTVE